MNELLIMIGLRVRVSKNSKIECWRVELAEFSYSIIYRPGPDNVAPDALTRVVCAAIQKGDLTKIHDALCHPGVTRLLHFVKSMNPPFSTEDVKKVCGQCRVCCHLKPQFYKPTESPTLIKAMYPIMDRISVDFKGPLPSVSSNKYMLTVVDEYSRFPFAFPCPDISSGTVTKCLDQVFNLCGFPSFVHSDRGRSFISQSMKSYFNARGIVSTTSTPYHPTGNSQCERYNGLIWKNVRLALMSQNLDVKHWESVLPNALHSLRSLLSTATNCTPHERFFSFPRRSPSGNSLPSWLVPGPVLLRNFVRSGKHDNLVNEVELIDVNPVFANIRYPDGRESSVSLRDLAPCPSGVEQQIESADAREEVPLNCSNEDDCASDRADREKLPDDVGPAGVSENDAASLRRQSSRVRRVPNKFDDFVLDT